MTASRRLMWTALAAAAFTWTAVAVLATRTEPATERVPAAAHVVEAVPPVEAPRSTAIEDPVPARSDGIIDRIAKPDAPDWRAGEVPDFLLERGGSSLRLRLIGDTDKAPLAMRVRLWRLGVAESDAWTAGDELREDLTVAEAGTAIDRLPSGTYRLQCMDLRIGADDPPAFTVGDGVTDRTVDVAQRRWFRLRMLLADETGQPIAHSVRVERGASSSSGSGSVHAPDWATPRRSKGGRSGFTSVGSVIGCGPAGRTPVRVDADDVGFYDLGRHLERGARGYATWSFDLRTDARADVEVNASDAIGVDTTFVGVAPRLDVLVAHVTRPDGKPADFTGTKIIAQSDAIRCPWNAPADAWRDIPVEVRFTCEGFEPMKFAWTANTADAPHVLVPWRR